MVLNSLTSDVWKKEIQSRVDANSLVTLSAFLAAQSAEKKTFYPPQALWFSALNQVNPEQTRVVILGQDPYHGPGQAQGLSFSVPKDQPLPPSLRNIFREQEADLGIVNQCGDLTAWAEQGVMLLNTVLTVEAGQANSHSGRGWEDITDAVIDGLNQQSQRIVFLLWGAHAQKKAARLDEQHHCILTAPHPSPLSAHRGFLGCRHFSKTNRFLETQGGSPIDWRTSGAAQQALF